MKGLVIREPWVGQILDGRKTWEIRRGNTRIRGPMALIASGTGTVVGKADLVDTIGPLSLPQMRQTTGKHRIPENELGALPYGDKTWAWVFKNPVRFEKPLPYRHPAGAVIWVNNLKSLSGKALSLLA